MNWTATAVSATIGGLAALAVSLVLAGWASTLTTGVGTRRWVPAAVSPARWVTTAAPAVPLGAAAAVLAPPPAWWLLGTGGAVLAVVDWRTHRLPAKFVHPLAAIVAMVLGASAAVTGDWAALTRAVLAAALVRALWFAVAFVSPAAVGVGDIRVAALTAGLLGWLGWPAVLLGQLAAFVLGAVTALVMVATGRGQLAGLRVPMGPALIGGAFLAAGFS